MLFLLYDDDSEAIDPLTINAPNLGSILRAPSVLYSSFVSRSSRSYLELQDGKASFLSGSQIQEGFPRQSTWWEKASIQMHVPEELSPGYGCSFTQTIFNGILLHFILVIQLCSTDTTEKKRQCQFDT